MTFAGEASPFQSADRLAKDAVGEAEIGWAMAISVGPGATSSSIVSRGPVHSIATPGASARKATSRLVKRLIAKSGAPSRNTRREVIGSNVLGDNAL